MSSEERIVRPFEDSPTLRDHLAGIRLLVGNELLKPHETRYLVPHELLSQRVRLQLASSPAEAKKRRDSLAAALETMDLSIDWVALVVLMSTPRLKLSEVLEIPFTEIGRTRTHVDIAGVEDRPNPLRAPAGGCTIDVYIVLSKALEPIRLKPWRYGTWLAHVRWSLRTGSAHQSWMPIPMTADDKEILGLPKGSVRFVSLEESPIAPGVDDAAIRLYVDEEVLRRLASAPSSPAARAFQCELFIDVVRAIVTGALKDDDFPNVSMVDIDGSLLAGLIQRIVRGREGDSQSALRRLHENYLELIRREPERFIAELEDRIGIRGELTKMFAGDPR